MPIPEDLIENIKSGNFENEILAFCYQDILYEDIQKLVEIIGNSHISGLNLMGTDIGDREAELLATINGLEFLSLRTTSITDAGVKALLKSSSIKRLGLSDNRLTDKAFEDIEDNIVLEELFLSYSIIGNKGVKNLSKSTTIRILNLTGNCLDDECARDLSLMQSLEEVNLSHNEISSIGYEFYIFLP
jgi:hypothetical protein